MSARGANPPAPFRVALTFDAEHADRPTVPGVTERILDALAATATLATFFVQGRWARAEPATAVRIDALDAVPGRRSAAASGSGAVATDAH